MTATFATEEEQALVGAVLAFANLRRIGSTRQVEDVFGRLPFVERLKVLPALEAHAYIGQQALLRDRLGRIVSNAAERERIGREVDAQLRRTVAVRLAFTEGQLRTTYALDGVEAAEALALALILDKRRGLVSRLQRCDAPRCGRFRLDFTTAGRPAKYCNAAHKVAAEIARRKEA